MTVETRSFSLIRLIAATSLLAPYTFAAAQSVNLSDVLGGRSVALTMKPSDLPASFVAVKTTMSSSADLLGMSSSILPYVLMGGQSGSTPEQFALLKAIGVSWTDGTTLDLSGHSYVVTYKLDFDLASLATSRTPGAMPSMKNAVLKLTLLQTDGIQSITPDTEYTKAQFISALGIESQADKDRPADASVMVADPGRAQSVALSNSKQLALGLLMYSNDYDDQFAYVQSTKGLQGVVRPYLKNDSLWNDPNPNGARFLFNMNLAGVVSSEVGEPATTPLIYEDKPWPDGRRVVAYADGHAKLVAKNAWPEVENALARKFKRTGKPLPPNYPQQ